MSGKPALSEEEALKAEIAASESAKAREEVALAQVLQDLSTGRGDGAFQCAYCSFRV